jgi:hypothetical protein
VCCLGLAALLIPLYFLNTYLPRKFMLIEPGKALDQLRQHSIIIQFAKQKYKRIARSLADQVFSKSSVFQPLVEDMIDGSSEDEELKDELHHS